MFGLFAARGPTEMLSADVRQLIMSCPKLTTQPLVLSPALGTRREGAWRISDTHACRQLPAFIFSGSCHSGGDGGLLHNAIA
jgi:hypothetical protein